MKRFGYYMHVVLAALTAIVGSAQLRADESVRVYCNLHGAEWKLATESQVNPTTATLSDTDRFRTQQFVATPPDGHFVSNWWWSASLDTSAMRPVVADDYTQVSQDALTCTLKYRDDCQSASLGVYFEYVPLTVTFDGNGGMAEKAMASIEGKNYDSPAFALTSNAFVRTGYHFDGWTNAVERSFEDGAKVSGPDLWNREKRAFDSKLWAKWRINGYKVAFDGCGATSGKMDPLVCEYGKSYNLPPVAFEKTGHAFAGWTNAVGAAFSDKGSFSNLSTENDATVVLYANWKDQAYTVWFDSQGAEIPGIRTVSVVYGDPLPWISKDLPARDGYDFGGYYDARDGDGKQYWNGAGAPQVETWDKVSNVTVYAKWHAHAHALRYENLSGSGADYPTSAKYGEEIELPLPVWLGHAFLGWTVSSGLAAKNPQWRQSEGGWRSIGKSWDKMVADADNPTKTIWLKNLNTNDQGSVTIVANWTTKSYKITLQHPGANNNPTSEMSIGWDARLEVIGSVPTYPENAGLLFQGYEDADGRLWYGADGRPTAEFSSYAWDHDADLTLKARTNGFDFNITYDGNPAENGAKTNWIEACNSSVPVTMPMSDRVPNPGRLLMGWDQASNQAPDHVIFQPGRQYSPWDLGATVDKRELKYYAIWSNVFYYVAFDANGGKGLPPDVLMKVYGTDLKLPKNSFIGKAHYDFIGWGLDPKTKSFDAEAVVGDDVFKAEMGVTNVLYAIWEYKPSEASLALDCAEQLYFESSSWETVDENPKVGENCLKHTSKPDVFGVLSARTDGFGGKLKFWWRGEYKSDPWNGDKQTVLTVSLGSGETYVTNCLENMNKVWQEVEIDVPAFDGQAVTFTHSGTEPCWLDGVSWVRDAAAVTNEVPTAIQGLVYNGNVQTGVVENVNCYYELVGNVATAAGDYVATATVTNGVWEGGATGATNITWSIAKATYDMSGVVFTNVTYVADGTVKSNLVDAATLPTGVTVTYDNNGQTKIDSYTVTAKFAGDAVNYEPIADMTATLTIVADPGPGPGPGPGPEPEPVVTNPVPAAVAGLVYDGAAQTGVPAGANYTIGGNVATNAGEYVSVATVTNGVWEGGATGATNIAWTIAKAPAPDVSGVTFADATFEYDGESHSIAVSGTVPSGVRVVYEGETNRTEVGTNTVTVSFEVLDKVNFEAITKTLTAKLAITAKEDPPDPPDPPVPPDPTVAYENIYFRATLAELGAAAVPTNRRITIKAEGLPKGLKLVTTALKDAKNKATGFYAYSIEGVPTERMDGVSRMAYVRVTDDKVQTLYALDLSVLWAKAYEEKSFPDGEVKSEYENFSVVTLWPDVSAHPKNWTFSGWPSGVKYATKDNKDAKAYEIYGKPTKAGRFTVKAVEKIPGTSYKSTHVATLTVWPEALELEAEWTDRAFDGVYRASGADVTAASGLPTGIRFAARDIVSRGEVTTAAHHFYGKPTKAGTYAVTLTHEDKSKTGFLWTITPAEAPSFELKLTETEVNPETAKATIRQGVSYDWAIDCTSNATVTASGLPTGLKLVKTAVKVGTKTVGYTYSVAGVPTKAGEFFTTFTAKLNGVSTVTTAAFVVLDLPAWAQGTFDGGADETFPVGGQVTFTVSKVGKLSGKWMSEGTNWTLSATSYDRYDEATGSYVAQMVGKTGSGKKAVAFTNETFVVADAVGGMATNGLFLAYQNNWKLEPWKSVGKSVAQAPTFEFHPYADAGDDHTNDVIALKFAASGKVTVKASYFKSASAAGKISWTTASGSAVLCPQTLPREGDTFLAAVFVYLPPKKNTPTAEAAYAVCIRLKWDGEEFRKWPEPE